MTRHTRRSHGVSRRSKATFLAAAISLAALGFSPGAARAEEPGLDEWCQESQAQLAACVVAALVVLPVVFLDELGERFEAACTADGGTYREGVGAGYPTGPAPETQWGCEGA